MTVEMVKGIARNVYRDQFALSSTVDTTDATATLLISIPTVDFERGVITYIINALKDDGISGLTIKRTFAYKNDGTTLSLSTQNDILVNSDFTTAAIAANVNGSTIEIKVTGEASINISWKGSFEQQNLIIEVEESL